MLYATYEQNNKDNDSSGIFYDSNFKTRNYGSNMSTFLTTKHEQKKFQITFDKSN